MRSYGSMWMSLAPSFAACVSSALIMRMIGASLRGLEQVLDRRQLLHHPRQVDRALDLADDDRGARLAAGVGGGDALRRAWPPARARSASTSYSAQHLGERRQADASRAPTAPGARRRPRAAACAPWRRRRAAGWRAPMRVLSAVGADAGAGAGRSGGTTRRRRRRRRRRPARGTAGVVPGELCGGDSGRRPRRAHRRDHRRLVDRHEHARRRLHAPAGRADLLVAVERDAVRGRRRRASRPGAGTPSGWCASWSRLSLRNSAPR